MLNKQSPQSISDYPQVNIIVLRLLLASNCGKRFGNMSDKTRLSAESSKLGKFVYINIPEEFSYNCICTINSGSAFNTVGSMDQHTRAT
jgi:hypothetical protein